MDKKAKRLRTSVLEKDIYTLDAIQGIGGYTSAKQEFTVSGLLAKQQKMQDTRRIETQKKGELQSARDNAVKEEYAFHEAILTARDQIRAQFGADSDEYQSIGMKKKSERKRPTKKAK
jgi:hypothetical protein